MWATECTLLLRKATSANIHDEQVVVVIVVVDVIVGVRICVLTFRLYFEFAIDG